MPHLCFHSFPRHRSDVPRDRVLRKAELVAGSLLRNGLLLAPENFEIPLLNDQGAQIDHLKVLQCRICFTELQPSEIENHSKVFGPYSLAFEIDDLRRIGGLPVHYVPMPHGTHLYGLASQIMAGVADATRVIEMLSKIRHQIEISPTLGMESIREVNGVMQRDGVRMNAEQTTVLRSFLDEFVQMCSVDLGITHQKLLAAAASFYPTEHVSRTEKLHYYRQREWRIVECGLLQDGQPIAPRANDVQKQALLSIDNDFFSKVVSVPSASGRVGEWEPALIADRCRFLSRVGDLDVIKLAKFLVIPDDADRESLMVREFQQRGIAVKFASELAVM